MPSFINNIRSYADFGRLRYKGGEFAGRLQLPGRAKLRWAPLGAAYRAKDALLCSSSDQVGFKALQPKLAAAPARSSAPDIFFPISAIMMNGVEDPSLGNFGVEDKVFEIINRNHQFTLNIEDIIGDYNSSHRRAIEGGKINPLDEAACLQAVYALRRKAKIKILPDGRVQYFAQLKDINSIAGKVQDMAKEITRLHTLVRIVFEESRLLREAGENLDLYLYDEKSGKLLRLADKDSGAPEFHSTYENWHRIEAGGIFYVLIRGQAFSHYEQEKNIRPLENFVFFRDIHEQVRHSPSGPILQSHLDRYDRAYKRPKHLRFNCPPAGEGKRFITTKRHAWEVNGSGFENRDFYSPNDDRRAIDAAYAALDQFVVSKIGEILNRAENKGKGLKEIWMEEGEEPSNPRIMAQEAKISSEPIFDVILRNSLKESHFGKTLIATKLDREAIQKLKPEEQELLLKELNFTGTTREDMKKHIIDVSQLTIIFHKDKKGAYIPVAFAAGREELYKPNGKTDQLAYLIGSMVREGFHGRHFQTVAHAMYMIDRWRVAKAQVGRFRPYRPIMQTESVGASAGFYKRFGDPKAGVLLAGHDLARARQFARHMEEECDEFGLVKKAYKKSVRNPKRDEQLLKKLWWRPWRRRKILNAVGDLEQGDARIHLSVFRWYHAFLMGFYANVIFRIRNRIYEWLHNK